MKRRNRCLLPGLFGLFLLVSAPTRAGEAAWSISQPAPSLPGEECGDACDSAFPQDPLLRDLLLRAERNNTDLELAAARLRQARAEREFASASNRPWLQGGLNAERRRQPESRLRDSDGNRHRIPAYRNSLFDTHLSAGYEIDLFGRKTLRTAGAEAQLSASEAELRAVRLNVRHEVIAAYADFRLANDLLALTRRAHELKETLLRVLSARVASGIDAPSRVRDAAHAADDFRQDIAAHQAARQHARARLAQLLGEEMASLAQSLNAAESTYFAREVAMPPLPTGLPAHVVARRPDVAAASKLLEASKMEAELVRLARYPALSLTGSLGFVSESLQRWLRGEALAWLLGSALDGPLLDGGRHAARHAGALAASEGAEAAWRRQVFTALAEVDNALSRLAASDTQLSALTAQHARLLKALASARQAQSAGRHGQGEVLLAELNVLAHELRLRSARCEHLAAWAASRHALGG